MLVLSTGLLSDVMPGQPTEHNGALSIALELFVTQELNKCYFLIGYNHSHIVICISSISKNTCIVCTESLLWIASELYFSVCVMFL